MIIFITIICDSRFWQALFSYRDHADIGNSHVERTGGKQTRNDMIKRDWIKAKIGRRKNEKKMAKKKNGLKQNRVGEKQNETDQIKNGLKNKTGQIHNKKNGCNKSR